MHLNIFVVSLFAVATLLQLANCSPTRHFDTSYVNEKEKLNGSNGFTVLSNNIPFKIQATQIKDRPPAYGPYDDSSSPSHVTQQTSDARPTSATDPSTATAPKSATTPSSVTPPTAMTKPTTHNY